MNSWTLIWVFGAHNFIEFGTNWKRGSTRRRKKGTWWEKTAAPCAPHRCCHYPEAAWVPSCAQDEGQG